MTANEWESSTNPEAMLDALNDAKVSTARLPVVLAGFAERGRLVGILGADLRQQFLAYARWVFGHGARPLPIELPVFDPLTPQGTDGFDADESLRHAMHGGIAPWLNVSTLALAELTRLRRGSSLHRPSGLVADEWRHRQAIALRDALGNPFAPERWEANWQTETVVALAARIHFDNAFDRLPILADALEEAGCDNADVLTHCRSPGPHARGCWVVDVARGKW